MLNDTTTPLALLRTRRSGRPRDMIAPGPSDRQLTAMLEIAARTPDHGKLAPWRFAVVPGTARAGLSAVITAAYRAERPQAAATEIAALEAFATQAPALVVVLSQPKPESHIPLWEQELSAGAACMNLLHAAHAMGFVAGWVTGWPTYSDAVRDAFAPAPARIAGFVFIGSTGAPLEERPRPAIEAVVSTWGT
ncbi:MAG: nitroreductase [Proteobacteria bacterium SG_bin6]|nr:MAG: nitroreductase [Proteobacteria bacterium SG_bin6]